ncbi:MAG: FkbM family methyltransferase [Alphaproteobacteria bacterium]
MAGTILHEQGLVRVRRCRHGVYAYLITDYYIGRSLDLYGEYSEGEMDFFRHAIRPGQTVLDIGANIGVHTIPLAQLAGESGSVLAFEPQRRLFQILCTNVVLNALGNVHAYPHAVGYGEAEIAMPKIDYGRANNFGGLGPPMAIEGRSDPVTQISVDSLDLQACHFMKVDVEGMENEVVAGAAGTIARLRPVLYLECNRGPRASELIARTLELDYRLYWHCPSLFSPRNFFENKENVFGAVISPNIICVPKERPQIVPNLIEIRHPDDPRPY